MYLPTDPLGIWEYADLFVTSHGVLYSFSIDVDTYSFIDRNSRRKHFEIVNRVSVLYNISHVILIYEFEKNQIYSWQFHVRRRSYI